MNLSQLYYFRKLAELQQYSKAAKELFLPLSALRQSILSLEQELEVTLFQEEGRNIRLTKFGEEFYQYICASLDELAKGIELAKIYSGCAGGTIDLGCIPSLLGDFLPHVMNGYIHDKNSKAKFNVYQGMSLSIIDGIKTGKYNLGFCSFIENEPDLYFTPVLSQEVVAIVNKSHPLAAEKAIYLRDLLKYSITTYRESLPIGKTVRSLLKEKGVDVCFSFDDEITVGNIITNNPLVAIAADTPYLKQFDNLVLIKLLDIPSDTRLLYMVYNKKALITKTCKSFIDYVTGEEI